MRRVFGGFILLLGVMLAGWIAYNLLVQRLPATQGRSPFVPIGAAAGFIYVGWKWVRGN